MALFLPLLTSAQMAPCGTQEGRVKWLQDYQENPGAYPKSNATIYVPMKIHIVGNDEGAGHTSLNRTLNAFCQLNEHFKDADIQFFISGEINYINNTLYYAHNYNNGYAMMEEHNVNNVFNCYIVSDPAGNCGYSVYGLGVALSRSCINTGSSTWAHEAGHYLSLPHTFSGWEGYDDFDYTQAAPNFIGNRMVERADSSNCENAGDRFCDTPADYLNYRWNCNSAGFSTITETDPNGIQFHSDGSLIMSYSTDNCTEMRFSEEQIDAMQANLMFDRPYLISSAQPMDAIPEDAMIEYVYPQDGQVLTDTISSITLEWAPIPNAQYYIVNMNPFPFFSFTIYDAIVATNSVTFHGLEANQDYYWQIRPYSSYSTCMRFSQKGTFTTGETITATEELSTLENLNIYPNPVKGNHSVTVVFSAKQREHLQVRILSMTGQQLQSISYEANQGDNNLQLSLNTISSGLYMVELIGVNDRIVRKLMVK
ncbi:MAG: hypothetical protein DHS20C18_17880 [Saprospiraceae bacterium]|nr:MAG: hypothetical protein DHS20C18_17880 [Saprospiraceae bacterium]